MLPEERQNMIVQIVNDVGAASVKELSARFAITEDSIRKDLTALQKRGLIRKTYGGAMRVEDELQERYVAQRKGKYTLDKQKIAKKVLRLLRDGELIFLDISTTNIEVAKLLRTSGMSLTIVTNMVDVMLTMAGDEFNKIIFIGGEFGEARSGFVGALTNHEIAKYRFDKAFLGVAGVNVASNSVMTYALDDATTKETIMRCSKQAYMLLETRKLSKDGNFVYSSVDNFYGAIVEKDLDEAQQKLFAGYDVLVI